jgi:hypothetical protein
MTNKNIISYQSIYSTQIYLNSSSSMLMNGTLKSYVHFYIQNAINANKKSAIEMRVSLVNAQFPCSFYQINNSNNTIIINDITYTFPNGNYNVNNFISTWYSIVGSTWLISFTSVTNKLIFTFTAPFNFTDNINNSIFPVIGFISGNTYSCIGNTLNAPYCVNFSGLSRLLISSPTFTLNSKTSYDSAMGNIIASVPNNCIQNGIIYYTNYTNYKSIFKNSELSCITIQIQDDDENYIDFNNLDWSLTIQIDIVHEVIEDLNSVDDIYETAKNELL